MGSSERRIGKYELIKKLGAGGMGVVYLGRDSQLNRDVAIKVLQPELAEQHDYIRRFRQEAHIIAKLKHPNIIEIYDFDIHDGVPYIVMEYLARGSLSQWLSAERPQLALDEIALLLEPIADALDYAHQHGVIHRDVKAGNIMFDEKGSPHLVDFGIAKLRSANIAATRTGVYIGTASYMAPEQWRGAAYILPATDQYALGILAYLLVTGALPFGGESMEVMLYKHMNEKPPKAHLLRSDVPTVLSDIIARAIAKEPHKRFATVKQFATAFHNAISRPNYTSPQISWQSLPVPLWIGAIVSLIVFGVIISIALFRGTGNGSVLLYQTQAIVLASQTVLAEVALATDIPSQMPSPTEEPTILVPSDIPTVTIAIIQRENAPHLVIGNTHRSLFLDQPSLGGRTRASVSDITLLIVGISLDREWLLVEYQEQHLWTVNQQTNNAVIIGDLSSVPVVK